MTMRLSKELETEAYRCFRCGFCRSQCPVFKAKQNESWNTRGRIILVKALMEGNLTLSPQIVERLYGCSLCKACETTCPAVVQISEIFKKARKEIYRSGLWPKVLMDISSSIEDQKNIYAMPRDDGTIWTMGMEGNINLKVGEKAKVAYFVGCASSFMGRLEGIPQSMIRILNHAGVDFTILGPEEWCCGEPLFLAGAPRLAEEIVKHNVKTFRELGIETLVASCAGCYRVWRQEYPAVIKEDLGFEVLHSSELLAQLMDTNKLKLKKGVKGTVTYHDPCEIGRHCGIYEAPRKVLENIPGIRLVELHKTKGECQCCGGGGLLKAVNPSLALDIASQKLDEVRAISAKIVTSGCAACKLNLTDAIKEREANLEMLDITEMVAKALKPSRPRLAPVILLPKFSP
ncbi:MAG: (Fe-S)-binding protein [Candidatus Bathyarchaeia archaeon]